jgi:hypothetical protein
MRLPRFRLWTLMVAVAIVGVLLGVAVGIAGMPPDRRDLLLMMMGPVLAVIGLRFLSRTIYLKATLGRRAQGPGPAAQADGAARAARRRNGAPPPHAGAGE